MKEEREPVGEHLLSYRLSPEKHTKNPSEFKNKHLNWLIFYILALEKSFDGEIQAKKVGLFCL